MGYRNILNLIGVRVVMGLVYLVVFFWWFNTVMDLSKMFGSWTAKKIFKKRVLNEP